MAEICQQMMLSKVLVWISFNNDALPRFYKSWEPMWSSNVHIHMQSSYRELNRVKETNICAEVGFSKMKKINSLVQNV